MQLNHMTWQEVDALARRTPIVIPIAATEQHGHHFPVSTDSMLLAEVVRPASERVADRAVFAPLVWLGNSHHHYDYPGGMSASPRVYLDMLCDLAVSRSLFNLRFKQYVGRTPKAEILHVRLERAKQLLIDTQLPVSRVSTLSGFSVGKYFIAVFNQRVGITPRAFRTKFGRFNGLNVDASPEPSLSLDRVPLSV